MVLLCGVHASRAAFAVLASNVLMGWVPTEYVGVSVNCDDREENWTEPLVLPRLGVLALISVSHVG
jgi:hypothetical protein